MQGYHTCRGEVSNRVQTLFIVRLSHQKNSVHCTVCTDASFIETANLKLQLQSTSVVALFMHSLSKPLI